MLLSQTNVIQCFFQGLTNKPINQTCGGFTNKKMGFEVKPWDLAPNMGSFRFIQVLTGTILRICSQNSGTSVDSKQNIWEFQDFMDFERQELVVL